MHVAFIPYGKREHVERFLRDMEAQKHLLPMRKGMEPSREIIEKSIWIDGQVRLLPFGIVEYVFPREDLDKVLTTLGAGNVGKYGINFKALPYGVLRKFLKLKKIPKFSSEKKYLWNREHVAVFCLGIRGDGDIMGTCASDDGFIHEAI